MRIDFQNSGQTQVAVTQAQIDMRDARSGKRPILRVLLVLVVLGAAGAAFYFLSRTGTVYTYGLVAAEYTPYYAPYEGTITELTLERGEVVEKGHLLFSLTPAQSETLKGAQDDLLEKLDRLSEEAAQRQQNLIDQAAKDVERLQAVRDSEVARIDAAVRRAGFEVEKRRNEYDTRKRQADRVSDLYELDAAVLSDVEAARNGAQVAQQNLKQARLELELAESQVAPSEAALAKAQLELERVRAEAGADPASLERGRLTLAVAQSSPEDLTVTSLFDGIILEVGATQGARVESGRVVVSMAATKNIWVEAYVPEKMAKYIHAGGEALVRLPGADEPIQGTIANESGQAIRVPELLRDNLPGLQTAVYVRINLDLADGQPVLPGGQVEVIIPTSAENALGEMLN